jgi:hypothetical protein
MLSLVFAALYLVVPALLALSLPSPARRSTRLLEALALFALLALSAQGFIPDRDARALAVSVLLYVGLRVGRSGALDATSATGLLATASFAICTLVEPTGPRAVLSGAGVLHVAWVFFAFERRLSALVIGLGIAGLALVGLFA